MKRLLYAVLLLAGIALVPVGPADAAACSGTSGVTVVVQFPDRTETGCAPGDPSSGYQALKWAGFEVVLATGSGAGAICSIDHYPDHDCPAMPPQSAYWAYFHAQPGGSWSYSSVGGGSYDPKPGTVEGWRFGSGSAPSSPPPGTKPSPSPTASSRPAGTPTARPTTAPTSGSPAGGTPATGGTAVAAPRATAGTPSGPDASASATGTPSTGASSAPNDGSVPSGQGAEAAGSLPKSPLRTESSGGGSWIWGVLLVGVLGAAAGTTAVRRRRS